MKPKYKAVMNDYPNVNVKIVDFDSNMDPFWDAGIKYLPTIKIFKDGKESEHYEGGRDEESFKGLF